MPENNNLSDQYDLDYFLDDPDQPDRTYRKPSKSERKKKKKGHVNRAVIISVILILLCGTVAAAALSGFMKNDDPAKAANLSSLSPSIPSDVSEVSEQADDRRFIPVGEFSYDMNKLSVLTRKRLTKNITSKYVVLYDMTSDKILYQKNNTKKCYPASTTKLMTAIVSSSVLRKDEIITVGTELDLVNEGSSTAGLEKGMKLTYEMLLDALMLPSGNDAAYTIAVNTARKYTGNDKLSDKQAVKEFMKLVNEALEDLECKNTHFVTPDGWHDNNHYTTAEDMCRIAAYARNIPEIKEACSKDFECWELLKDEPESSAEVTSSDSSEKSSQQSSSDSASAASESSAESSTTSNKSDKSETEKSRSEKNKDESKTDESEPEEPRYLQWYNTNLLIQAYSELYSPEADGMKTGFTDEAGSCVIATATVKGHTMIAVVMDGSGYGKYQDANRLFEAGFAIYDLPYTYYNMPYDIDEPEESSEASKKSEKSEASKKSDSSEASVKTSADSR